MAGGSDGLGDLLHAELDPGGRWHLTGELDVSNADALLDRIRSSALGDEVVLDLTGLRFMDSSGIRVVVMLLRQLGDEGRMVLRLREGAVARTIRVSDLGSVPNVQVEMVDA